MKKNKSILKKKIKIVLSDVDGVLTDGGMYYSKTGEAMKKFNTKDGMGVELLRKIGIPTILITKEKSLITKKRSQKIKAQLFEGVLNKEMFLPKICLQYNIKNSEIAYIGDDVNDIEIMKKIGLSCCPSDAIHKVKKISHLISSKNGGDGCFREFSDYIIKNFS